VLLRLAGADNVMLSWRAVKDEALEATLNNHLELFSTEGLRTLVLAERYLDEDEYRAWDQKFKAALMELDDRQEKSV
jgi:phospholipid-translocating ATPase